MEVFRPLLYTDTSDYNPDFTLQDYIDSRIWHKIYTVIESYVGRYWLLHQIGYTISIAGIGSTAIAYIVYKRKVGRGRMDNTKYIWDSGDAKDNYILYETDVRGQQLLKSILPMYTVNYYYHYYGNFGLIIMHKAQRWIELNWLPMNDN